MTPEKRHEARKWVAHALSNGLQRFTPSEMVEFAHILLAEAQKVELLHDQRRSR